MVRFRVLAVVAAVAAALFPAAAQPAHAAGPSIAGGDVLTGSGRCQVAFNVSQRGILTGNCGPVGTQWYSGAALVGHVSWVAPDGLTGLVTIDNPAVTQLAGVRAPGGPIIPIVTAARVPIGTTLQAVSPVTGLRTGVLTATNLTINHPQGALYGLDRATVCSEAGETGKPIFRGSTAVGIAVGSTGTCSSGGSTYGRPVTQVLQQTGRTVY